MSSIDPITPSHPDDLLEAYSLDTLEESEGILVEAHVDSCPRCQQVVSGFQEAVSLLADAVDQQPPPPSLRAQVLNSLPAQPMPAAVAVPLAVATSVTLSYRLTRWLLPVAAVIMIGLFSTTLVMHQQVSNRLDQLEQENSTVSVRLDQAMVQEAQSNLRIADRVDVLEQASDHANLMLSETLAKDSQFENTINQIRATNYLMANPSTRPLLLESPDGNGSAQGVLLVSDGGRRAVLMVADMQQPDPTSSYQIWLARRGQRVPMGEVRVDSAGWGTKTLSPPESLYQFAWVNITQESVPSMDAPTGAMVLRSKIPASGTNP